MLVVALLGAIAGPAYADCGKHRVQVYSVYWCPVCRATEQFLASHKIKYERFEVTAGNVQKYIRKFGTDAVPLVIIHGRRRLGHDPAWLRKTLCIR